jgi:alpha-ketoglutarate-dependent taurine dioxygenase
MFRGCRKPAYGLRKFQVVHIMPQEGADPHSFRGSEDFPLHTDSTWIPSPPRFVTMLCLQPDSTGAGKSLIVDGYKLLDYLQPAQRAELQRQELSFRSHRDTPAYSAIRSTILSRNSDGGWLLRLRRDLILEPLPEAAVVLLDLAQTHAVEFALEKGECIDIDNHRMLHGRRKLSGLLSDRALLRVHSDLLE